MSGPPSPSEFATALFPLLLGSILTCPLYGIALAQGVSYFRNYPQDGPFMRYGIALLLLVDGAHTFSLADAVKVWYLRQEVSLVYPKGLPVSLFFSYLTMGFVQSAFALRVWILSGRKWILSSILAFFILCQIVGGLGMAATQDANGAASSVNDVRSETFGSLELCSAIVCDIMISASLVYLLQKNRSGIKTTESLIDRLIVYVIGIGTLSCVFALLNLVTWLAMPSKLIFTTFHSVISKLYVNSLLVTLNSRQRVRNDINKVHVSGNATYASYGSDTLALSTFDAGVNSRFNETRSVDY